MKQKINIKKFIDKHSEAIAVTASGVAIIVAFTLGHMISMRPKLLLLLLKVEGKQPVLKM